MKRLKNVVRRIVLLMAIIIATMIPVPIFFQKKEGKFNNDYTIELIETKEENTETKTVKFNDELGS